MSERGPFPAGTVDWSGENPGMNLKETEDGPYVTLISFFRVVASPHGRGEGVVLLEAPDAEQSTPEAMNICASNNEPLARYLAENFFCHFGSFKDRPGLKGMEYKAVQNVSTTSDLPRTYIEDLHGDGLHIRLAWNDLSAPFMVDMAPDRSPTGAHEMFSLFCDCGRAQATLNGKPLPGRSFPRDFAGRKSTTAFLAFSETWLRV